MRYHLACILLFALWPSTAAASVCPQEAEEIPSFVARDAEFPAGCARATSGLELLVELTGRTIARKLERQAPSLRDPRGAAPLSRRHPPSILSRREALAREIGTRCCDGSFVIYLPYHANPPPVLS